MIAGNIFKLIGELFTDVLFIPFNFLRLGGFNWWSSNMINWLFVVIFLVLFTYWMKESLRFKKQGLEDLAE